MEHTKNHQPDLQENMLPKISVIIPTYNRRHLLPFAIQSILDQTYTDFEIIVVDDASTDGTKEVLSRFKDKRIRYIRHGENRGISAARNTGIHASKGDFVAFLDDDDTHLPGKLMSQLNIIESSDLNVGLVYVGIQYVDEYGNPIGISLPSKSIWYGLSHSDFIGGQTPLVRKKCFDEIGVFDEDLPYFEDRDMWLRLSDKYKFTFVKAPLARIRQHSGRITRNYTRQLEGLERFHLKHSSRIALATPDVRNNIWFGYHCHKAEIFNNHNRTQEARQEIIRAIKLKPFAIASYKQLVCCLVWWPLGKRLSSRRNFVLLWRGIKRMKAKQVSWKKESEGSST